MICFCFLGLLLDGRFGRNIRLEPNSPTLQNENPPEVVFVEMVLVGK